MDTTRTILTVNNKPGTAQSRVHRRGTATRPAVLAILLLCTLASAQSPLSLRYPLGLPDLAVTGASAAMGAAGVAVAEENWGIALNPANAAIGNRSAFSALVSYNITNVTDDGEEGSISGYSPKLLSLIIPLGRAGNLGFAMQKRSDANLNFFISDVHEERLYSDNYDEQYTVVRTNTIEHFRTGSLTAWQAGWAYRFKSGHSFGIGYERLYFNREFRHVFESHLDYQWENGRQYRARTEEMQKAYFACDAIRFGIQLPLHNKVTFGATAEYTFPGSSNGNETREYYIRSNQSGQSGPIDEISEGEFSASLPPSISAGVAYRPNDSWLFAVDARSTLWESYENTLDNDKAYATYGVSAGARFIPAPKKLISEYWQKIHYSAGLRYASLPHNGAADGGAHEYAVTFGTSLPVPNDGGMVDIAFDIGRRTDARYDKYHENIVKIQLGINGGRNWFQRE